MDRSRVWHPPTHAAARFTIHLLSYNLPPRYVLPTLPLTPQSYSKTVLTPCISSGVPRPEILRVSELLATKLIENEFAAYENLQSLMASPDALSKRGYTIASYALCGFANLGSLGIQIGVLSALAPSRTRVIARIGPSTVIAGFISTLQAAGIACVYCQSAAADL